MIDAIKRRLGTKTRRQLRKVNRLRWVSKFRLLRQYGVRIRDAPRHHIAYVLFDPEIESHSYELDNEPELAAFVAALVGRPFEEINRYLEEVRDDPELNQRLAEHIGWRLDCKRHLPLGNRLLWYVLARSLKPRLIVETGIYDGLGSLCLLRALDRNAEDGAEGRLISVDIDPAAGWLVADRLRDRWTRLEGTSEEVLAGAISGRDVGLFFQDATPHTYERQRFEFRLALDHAAETLVIASGGGGQTGAMDEVCEAGGGSRAIFVERPRHGFPGRTRETHICVLPG